MQISVFKDLLKSKEVPFIVPIEKVVNRIKLGKSKDLIERIRNGEDLKKQLPCILFAGEFTERNSNGLVNHSGLMIVDFDKYPNMETMNNHLELLKQNKHFCLLFISPSGNGIKGVVKIPIATKETHPKYFKAFQKKFDYDYFDISNSNVDRVCFESYDPNIYINYDAEIFDTIIVDEGFKIAEKVPLIPITDEDKIIDKIMKFNWQKGFNEGERNAYIFDLAGAFCEYGIQEYNAQGYIFNNVVIGDFSEQEVKNTIKSAYRKRQFDSKFFEDYNKIDKIKVDLSKGKDEVIRLHNIKEDVYNELKEVHDHEDFWFLDKKDNIKIDSHKYKLFLENKGFAKHYPNGSDKPMFVYVKENKVKESSISRIKDFVLNYLLENGKIDVFNYCSTYHNLFTEQYLIMLETIDLLMMQDYAYKSFIPFKNGILEVTKTNAVLKEYFEMDGYIWDSQILDRDWIPSKNNDNDYKRFINNISHNDPTAIEAAIGYLLLNYKNRSQNKAIILNDELISESPEGGTGKGLFVQGIGQIRRCDIIDGKQFDSKKSFAYQTISLETRVLVFDDVKKGFDFENNFSLITEGITLERKNKDAIKLNVHESPKVIISTNYAIKGDGHSQDRRRHELEIAQFYGKNLTPEQDFGRQLFDDWSFDDFNKFDNYMVECLQTYFALGLIAQNSKNSKKRKFISATSPEFDEWTNDSENLPSGIRLDKQIYLDNFKRDYPDFAQFKLTHKRFQIWIQKYCSYKDLKYDDGNSNGMKWFTIGEVEQDSNDLAF